MRKKFVSSVVAPCNCHDLFELPFDIRVNLAHPFWALETLPVCCSVLSCWTNRATSMGTKWSSWIWKETCHT